MSIKERPILFNGDMVRALLDGRKTVTRRVVKPQPMEHHWHGLKGYTHRTKLMMTGDGLRLRSSHHIPGNHLCEDGVEWIRCPYGQPGDRLWVRETWGTDCRVDSTPSGKPYDNCVLYRAHDEPPTTAQWETFKWRPSIHMPRWASRITLEITGVRVERLQDISEADALNEGVHYECPDCCYTHADEGIHMDHRVCVSLGGPELPSARSLFRALWDSINGKKKGRRWADNPYVWVVSFDVVKEDEG